MLDPAAPSSLDLTDFSTYIKSCVDLANQRLANTKSPEAAAELEARLNQYPRLEMLNEPRDIFVVDENSLGPAEQKEAVNALLKGEVLLEHTCAGEATRLGLGTKYLINPPKDLTPEVIKRLLPQGKDCPLNPGSLHSMSLGRRHMLQLAWDLSDLAQKNGLDPEVVLKRQKLLVIINEAAGEKVLEDFLEASFYGFQREKVFFMVQKSFHGLSHGKNGWFYDLESPKRLHNHGQMFMQTTMDHQLFILDDKGNPQTLPWAEYQKILAACVDKVSFNIEDLDYLNNSLDFTGLAAALKLAKEGVGMVMEVVANNPVNPQKGGLCAFDAGLDRNVMIESFQLAGMPNSEIKYLNKNINHYPDPLTAVKAVRERGLAMSITLKGGYLYFQPVQGDVNFLVPTAFLRRANLKPISSWKSGANTIDALQAMAAQEKRPGFMAWAKDLMGRGV
jgi:hypothetical protein